MEIPVKISWENISNLLCNALEGGSNYWYNIEEMHAPEDYSSVRSSENMIHSHLDYPCNPGGYLVFSSLEDDEINGQSRWVLDGASIYYGLKIMAEKYPKHFGDFIADNDDAITGDVFLQCCLFGEMIYG